MQIKVAKPFLKEINYPIFYVAYGSNLNKHQMQKRCPYANPITKSYIEGYGLLFRSVATIVKEKESIMPCGIWQISRDCEKALDKYEGYPSMYGKEYWEGSFEGKTYPFLVYIMNKQVRSIAPPHPVYLEKIKNGYRDFDIPLRYLENHEQLEVFFKDMS